MIKNGARVLVLAATAMLAVGCGKQQAELATEGRAQVLATSGAINVVLNQPVTDALLADLGKYGTVGRVIHEINALTMNLSGASLAKVKALPYVAAANPDYERNAGPFDAVAAEDFSNGRSTWDQDAVDVTNFGTTTRAVAYDGSGVYVGVLDTGLHDSWRTYFPQERIATQYAASFSGGSPSALAAPPNAWEHDQNGHGSHVTSSIIGYNLRGSAINGTAPGATVIPVKVCLNGNNGLYGQGGGCFSSAISRGVVHIANLKAKELSASPVVINMSLGGPNLDAMEQAAIDYAIEKGVIVVASAGNEGEAGMGYPGAYTPVISVAASGWTGEWQNGNRSWWISTDVPDPTSAGDFYITDFSSRAKAGQDLDVAAPGSWVVGPYQLNSAAGQPSYYFLGGTSMASPHVAGIVALMAQKKPTLTPAEAESVLTSTAIPLAAGDRQITDISGQTVTVTWGSDATGSGLATAPRALAGIDRMDATGGKRRK